MKCCIDCEKRYPGCHDVCPERLEELKVYRERADKIRKAKEEEWLKNGYIREHYKSRRR